MPLSVRSASLGAALLAACAGSPPSVAPPVPGPAAGISSAWPYAGKAGVALGSRAMVVSSSPIASAVGRDILQHGGNAVDAAVAVGFALAVVHPAAGNIGGGGFMLIRMADGTVQALDYRETAPGRASHDMFLNRAGEPTALSERGHLSAGVPGSVAGLVEAHRQRGRLPFAQLMAPAIALADTGFILDRDRSESLDEHRAWFHFFPASRRYFLTDHGQAPATGARLTQHDLARTLAAIRDHGADGFYRGWVADSLVAEMERGGGLISHEDLAGYRPLWREPIRVSYRGYTVLSMAPASSGGVTLGVILNVMEGFGTLPPFGSAPLMHREAEAMRRAFIDRNTWLGDPGFVRMPIERLLSRQHADSLRQTIDLAHATPTPPFDPTLRDASSTTHYSVIDAEGNAVSCTTTLNDSFGSAVAVSGAGFLLNDEMDDFTTAVGQPNGYGLVQGEANAIQPGKRMLSAMTPSIVLDQQGQLFLVLGTPGGSTIITQVYHVISNVIDHNMSLPDAVAAPKLHHQSLPDLIRLEPDGFQPGAIAGLEALGHRIDFHSPWGSRHWGDLEAIIRTPAGWQGVSDPRGGGGGAGY